jgi:hypothetical protein
MAIGAPTLGAKPPDVMIANLAVLANNRRAFAHRHFAVDRAKPTSFACWTLVPRPSNAVGTVEPALFAAAL